MQVFKVNFDYLLAEVKCNTIHIMTASTLRVIDVLEGHRLPIECMDISTVQRNIVSYSPGRLIFYAIDRDYCVNQDQVVYCGTIKWKLTY